MSLSRLCRAPPPPPPARSPAHVLPPLGSGLCQGHCLAPSVSGGAPQRGPFRPQLGPGPRPWASARGSRAVPSAAALTCQEPVRNRGRCPPAAQRGPGVGYRPQEPNSRVLPGTGPPPFRLQTHRVALGRGFATSPRLRARVTTPPHCPQARGLWVLLSPIPHMGPREAWGTLVPEGAWGAGGGHPSAVHGDAGCWVGRGRGDVSWAGGAWVPGVPIRPSPGGPEPRARGRGCRLA